MIRQRRRSVERTQALLHLKSQATPCVGWGLSVWRRHGRDAAGPV